MKKIFYSLAVVCLALVSCSKEVSVVDEFPYGEDGFYIKGYYTNNQETKTTYNYSDGKYAFNWLNGDKVAVMMIKKADSSYDASALANSAADGAVATFGAAGNASYDLGEYAFYPCRYPDENYQYDSYAGKYLYWSSYQTDLLYLKNGTAVADQAAADAAPSATVRLFGTIVEDASQPMRHIPLIGKRQGETNDFFFKAATGVLKVTVNGLPAEACQIRLDAVDYALNGYFVFDENCEIKESYAKSGYGQKYMNFTPGDANRTFYFPIPTGTLEAGKLTISVADDSNNVLYSVKNTEDIAVVRGQVMALPSITFPSVSVKFTGNHQATVYFSGDVKKVSWTTAQNSAYTTRGNHSQYVTVSGSIINLGDSYADNGIRYFGYAAYNDVDATTGSDAAVVKEESAIPYYNPTLSSAVLGNYAWVQPGDRTSVVKTNTTFGASLGSTPSITFAASDNISKGNIMISAFCGKETRKVYGFYLNSTTDLKFDTADQPIFIEDGARYHLREGYNNYVRFRVGTGLSVYSGTADLYCQGGNFYIWHGDTFDSASADYDISFFLANKE